MKLPQRKKRGTIKSREQTRLPSNAIRASQKDYPKPFRVSETTLFASDFGVPVEAPKTALNYRTSSGHVLKPLSAVVYPRGRLRGMILSEGFDSSKKYSYVITKMAVYARIGQNKYILLAESQPPRVGEFK